MGANQSLVTNLKLSSVLKEANQRLGAPTMENLSADWERVAGSKKKEINFQQFSTLMQQLESDELKALFQLYDINHNGYISWKEYVCVVVLIMQGGLDEKLKLLFNAFDENRDGSISRKELEDACSKFSKKRDLGSNFVEDVWQKCDVNQDGEISFDEFKTFLSKNSKLFGDVCGILAVGLQFQ
eukprot:TRINITY_DN356_c0_g2_i1.p1 TRINITY_DN356_c0_g2~~TRINITY_DN356_c0_g2_i1.p1  ORF type:complete len:184 (-),score=37.49 TRINITY_DN356_c0_g2_i1:216-767(-)